MYKFKDMCVDICTCFCVHVFFFSKALAWPMYLGRIIIPSCFVHHSPFFPPALTSFG